MTYKAPARSVGRLKRPFGDLYYEVSGSGPALLFAHGLGGNHLSWWQQVAHFAPHYTCVTLRPSRLRAVRARSTAAPILPTTPPTSPR